MEISWEEFTIYQLGVRAGQAVVLTDVSAAYVPLGQVRAAVGRLINAINEVPDTSPFTGQYPGLLQPVAEQLQQQLMQLDAAEEVELRRCYAHHCGLLQSALTRVRQPGQLLTDEDRQSAMFRLGWELANAEPDPPRPLPGDTAAKRPAARNPATPPGSSGWLFENAEIVAAALAELGGNLVDVLPPTDLTGGDEGYTAMAWCDEVLVPTRDWWPVELGLFRLRQRLAARPLRESAAGVTPAGGNATKPAMEQFVPTMDQREILEALEDNGLTKVQLAHKIEVSESQLYRPGYLKELLDLGLVKNKRGVGYYRPDAPPPGTRDLPAE